MLEIGKEANTAYVYKGKFLGASPGSKQGIFGPRLEYSVFIVMKVSSSTPIQFSNIPRQELLTQPPKQVRCVSLAV